MAGNQAGKPEQPQKKTYSAKTFECTKCGAPVQIKYPGVSLSISCPNCHVVIDVTNENYRILSKYYDKTKAYDPIIPLGTRGKLFDKLWEVLGFIIRKDKLSGYSWEEYLLFNPYYGYRFLTRNNGHWSFVTMLKDKPFASKEALERITSTTFEYKDLRYRIFYSGHAVVSYVLGEFYWKVKTETEVWMTDYICPPYMMSNEWNNKELIWSQSQYVDVKKIKEEFKIEAMAMPLGVAPNQPSPHLGNWKVMSKLWLFFAVMLFCMQFICASGARNDNAYQQSFVFETNQKKNDTTTPTFILIKDKSNVDIRFNADVDNSWFYISGEMVNDETGDTFYFERTAEYYHGYEGGESWSEGSREANILLCNVPGGKYYINFDYESGDFKILGNKFFSITVLRDVPTYANFFWSLFLLSIFPMISWFNMRHVEVARWSESDYSPYQSSS